MDIICQFCEQFKSEVAIFHLSPGTITLQVLNSNQQIVLGNSLQLSLIQSGVDISQLPALHISSPLERIKSVPIQTIQQLLAFIELLNTSLFDEKSILILEGMQYILFSFKVRPLTYFTILMLIDVVFFDRV